MKRTSLKEGRFVTIDDRVVFIGGPGGGGGGSSAGSEPERLEARAQVFAEALREKLGVKTTISFVDSLPVHFDDTGETLQASGQYVPEKDTIVLNRTNLKPDGNLDAIGFEYDNAMGGDYRAIIAHEMLHAWDFEPRRPRNYEPDAMKVLDASLDRLIEGDTTAYVSRYARSSSAEFIAETGAVYLLNPGYLRKNNVPAYDYFKLHLGE